MSYLAIKSYFVDKLLLAVELRFRRLINFVIRREEIVFVEDSSRSIRNCTSLKLVTAKTADYFLLIRHGNLISYLICSLNFVPLFSIDLLSEAHSLPFHSSLCYSLFLTPFTFFFLFLLSVIQYIRLLIVAWHQCRLKLDWL